MGIPFIRMAGEVGKYIRRNPHGAAGDALGGAAETMNPHEPDPVKRALLTVGVPILGTAASALTAGVDVIPQVMDLAGSLGEEYGFPELPPMLRDAFGCAPLLNADNYSRLMLGATASPQIKENLTRAKEFCGRYKERSRNIPRPSTLIMPVR
jgi:hypothetical protein